MGDQRRPGRRPGMRSLSHGQNRTSLIISRRTHPLVKELRDLRDNPQPTLLFLEGPKLVEEALKASIPLKTLILSASLKGHNEIVGRAKVSAPSVFSVTDAIFEAITDVEEPQ